MRQRPAGRTGQRGGARDWEPDLCDRLIEPTFVGGSCLRTHGAQRSRRRHLPRGERGEGPCTATARSRCRQSADVDAP